MANSENLGVAGGRNRGFREAILRGADYVLSLDNDTRIESKLIHALVAVAESDFHIGIVGPKTYMDDDSGRMQCAGGKVTHRPCTLRADIASVGQHMLPFLSVLAVLLMQSVIYPSDVYVPGMRLFWSCVVGFLVSLMVSIPFLYWAGKHTRLFTFMVKPSELCCLTK